MDEKLTDDAGYIHIIRLYLPLSTVKNCNVGLSPNTQVVNLICYG
jgi:hypothetical protein